MGISKELAAQAEAEVNHELQEALAAVTECANNLGIDVQPEDVLKALLPRSATIKNKLIVQRRQSIEHRLVEIYKDQAGVKAEEGDD